MFQISKRIYALIGIYCRGFFMGAADLVPGVSGGTIAFISGIYPRLLNAIAVFSRKLFWQHVWQRQFKSLWQICDGTFLLILVCGVISAVISLSSLLHHGLDKIPHLILAFFLGLVIASIWVVYRRWQGYHTKHLIVSGLSCLATAYLVNLPALVNESPHWYFLFGGGMIAICAMLLPGISGSYILLILGLYTTIIDALHQRDFLTLLVFAAGCGVGILFFARLIDYWLKNYFQMTIGILLGVMLGALPKLWPWKNDAFGTKIILQKNIMPTADIDITFVIIALLLGFFVVIVLNQFTTDKN